MRGPGVLISVVPGSLVLQAQSGTRCVLSRSDYDNQPAVNKSLEGVTTRRGDQLVVIIEQKTLLH